MQDKTFLMIPGPTPVPESVLLAMAKHPIGHRSSEFSAILEETYADLKWLFQTENDVFIYTSSGTGAMEGALSNLINEGDKVLSLVIGNFGARWAKIASKFGADVEKIEVPFGQAIDPKVLKERLDADVNKEIKIVTLTHNETATGVTNPLKELAAIIKEHGAVSVVDGVTSVGAIECKMDEWGIDVLISGSQKGFMIPPGLSFLAASEKAKNEEVVIEPTEKSIPEPEAKPSAVNTVNEAATVSAKARRAQLLGALKPYVSGERAKAIDSMMSIAEILEVMKVR